jgi:hypothetical protein
MHTPGDDEDGLEWTIDQLPEPVRGLILQLEAHHDHPARGWFDRLGNGIFEDDHSVRGLPGPHPIYRFTRGDEAAYVWEDECGWVVRPWRRMRDRVSNAVVRVGNLRAALDVLTAPPRSWWQFWG